MPQIELRPFLQALGGPLGRAPLDVQERLEPEDPATLLEDDIVEVTAAPPPPASTVFLDGIQSATTLTYRNHRPLTLAMAGAGAVTGRLEPVMVEETLDLLAARADIAWAEEQGCPTAIRCISESDAPTDVEREVGNCLGQERDALEVLLTQRLALDDQWDLICVDGGLAGRPGDHRIVGIVKTTNTRLLNDESVLWRLPEGYRSPAFQLPPHYGGSDAAPRMSAYVRMRDASDAAWQTGLVRVEAYSKEALDLAAATALAYRQPTATTDPRGDRHISPIAHVETWMRSRRPTYL